MIQFAARAALGIALFVVVGCTPESEAPRPGAIPGLDELVESAVALPFDVPENVQDEPWIEFPEASGITYHPLRKTLFVVSDDGDVGEYRTDGSLVQRRHLIHEDFEGITSNPSTGLLYLVIEGRDNLLEVDPEGLVIRREYDLDRKFEGRKLYEFGGEGLEGVAFVPDPGHPEGGTFFVANRSRHPKALEDPPLIVEMELPLSDPSNDALKGHIRSYALLQITELAGLHYEAATDRLYAVSEDNQLLIELTRDGEIVKIYELPLEDAEGVAMDPDGNLYIAQDSGQVVKLPARARATGG